MNQDLYNAATTNFNLPHDMVQLPTGGVFYKSKKKSIKVGYLTANDENILSNALSNNNTQSFILSLLRNKIYEHDLKPEEMMDSDIEAVLLFLRNTSFGPEYKLSLTDPKTNQRFETSILLDELNIKPGKMEPDKDGCFQTTLPKSGDIIKVKPLTFGEQLELENRENLYPKGRDIPKITWRLEKQIQDVNGNTDKGFISTYVVSLPIADSKFIRSFINENVPSLDLSKSVIAPSGEEVIANITFGVEFFRPFF